MSGELTSLVEEVVEPVLKYCKPLEEELELLTVVTMLMLSRKFWKSGARNVATEQWLWRFQVVMVEEGMLPHQHRQRELLLRRMGQQVQTFLRWLNKLRSTLSHRPNEVWKFLIRELVMKTRRFLRLLTKNNLMMGLRCDLRPNRILEIPSWQFESHFRDREVFEIEPTDRDPTVEGCPRPKKQ